MSHQRHSLDDRAFPGSLSDVSVAANAEIDSSKLAAFSEPRDANNQSIENLADPVNDQDATNKRWVTDLVEMARQGMHSKDSVRVSFPAAIDGTYDPTGGTSGTGQLSGMPSVEGAINLALGDRILLTEETDKTHNAAWVVTTVGTGADGVWERTTDFDDDNDTYDEGAAGATFLVREGSRTLQKWSLANTGDPNIGGAAGDDLLFVQTGGANGVVDGDNVTTEKNASGILSVRDGGIGVGQRADVPVTTFTPALDGLSTGPFTMSRAIDPNKEPLYIDGFREIAGQGYTLNAAGDEFTLSAPWPATTNIEVGTK